ncbi:thiosulfate oxidation carrier protein SoxY [Pseudorhodoferax soli]|uniref:Sulfur-oxidizing protein SoxY n=1 Tax=Pseudorhodoferax soli TaxID=545864 RepID=A0A368Y9U6_9BURK|nr:thiosulfate oxidation carrier protein SoxY [Pseudorhodoferax soli]RCW75587.1 sulfur-oxidizing protein SoxY [Pseudorhodoferax soli]
MTVFDPQRRQALALGTGLAASLVVRPGAAATGDLAAAIATFTGGRTPEPGRVRLDISTLVENGNAVPVTLSVDDGVALPQLRSLALFNERNPQRDVARFRFGPASGRAWAATRIRLATSQKLVAVALLEDGSAFSHTVDVVVTLAACIE